MGLWSSFLCVYLLPFVELVNRGLRGPYEFGNQREKQQVEDLEGRVPLFFIRVIHFSI